MQKGKIIIAVDGYSSCGKSTLAKALARELGYIYIDSGAMYRAVTLMALRNNWIIDGKPDKRAILEGVENFSVTFYFDPETGENTTMLNGENVEEEIRQLRVSQWVSPVSAIGEVRRAMVRIQQEMGEKKGIVMDGRDIGTVVFPEAELKIFMTADPEIRAMRRYRELLGKGETISLDEVRENIAHRDHIDQTREESPLRKADDAVLLDNSYLTPDEQLEWALRKAHQIMGTTETDTGLRIEIDNKSGFCFGVVNAIRKAGEELKHHGTLYCLGDIVHNSAEIDRLKELGMITITREEYFTMSNCRVLIRAHGAPPEIYRYARQNSIELIDATCPVVLKLQKRVKTAHSNLTRINGQLLLFAKPGHAETVGLNGQTGNQAIIIRSKDDLEQIDFSRPIELFSQTTMPIREFNELTALIREKAGDNSMVTIRDTICRQVTNRGPHLSEFATQFDVIIFVAGRKSSNGAALFQICRSVNQRSHLIENPSELEASWFEGAHSAGICGATSTPRWLMEKVADAIKTMT